MTVLGVGTDIVDIPTFSAQLGLPGSRLVEVFTSRERRRATQRAAESGKNADAEEAVGSSQHLAAVWALKEAFIKAWSGALFGVEPPLGRDSVDFTEIEVRHDRWGRPSLDLYGNVADAVAATVGASGPVQLLASASHDGDVACAVVLLSREAEAQLDAAG